jgi:hypothetical protein
MGELTVVYDACVLYPAPIRDLLMWLAVSGRFRARWTDAIHDEWTRSVARNRPDLSPENLRRTRELMNLHVPGCLVTGYESLIDSLHLPDANDRHVLAAAIHCGADRIVTFNLIDFPESGLKPYRIQAQHPDDFICELAKTDTAAVCAAARAQRTSLHKPPKTVAQHLDTLHGVGLTEVAAFLREHENDI